MQDRYFVEKVHGWEEHANGNDDVLLKCEAVLLKIYDLVIFALHRVQVVHTMTEFVAFLCTLSWR